MHAVVWNGDCPEEALLVGSRIEIVDLLGIRIRSRTRENIQSDESEGAVVNPAIAPDIRSGHETVVGIEEQMTWLAAGFGPGSSASYICKADEALEVGDQGGVSGWAGQEEVKQWSLGAKQLHAPRDRIR